MKSKFGPKSTTTAVYTGVFLLIMTVVAIGYQPPEETEVNVANAASAFSVGTEADQPSVDEIVATNVAAKIAKSANLPVAANIANQAVSLSIRSELAQANEASSIVKPQILQPSANSRTVKTYTVVKGDTVESIAKKFDISQDTVKWVNDISGNSVSVGKELKILPVDGVLYKVGDGDSLESLASRYGTSAQVITVFNDLELSGLVSGKEIILPSGELPEVDRPGYVAPRPVFRAQYAGGYNGGSIQVLGSGAVNSLIPGVSLYKNNGAALGNCTWWVIERRAAMGRPLPGGALGNAADYIYTLSHRPINKSPAVGAIMQNGGGYGGYGHVAIVESVNGDGSVTVSEMNYGWATYQVNYRTIPASAVHSFNYIH